MAVALLVVDNSVAVFWRGRFVGETSGAGAGGGDEDAVSIVSVCFVGLTSDGCVDDMYPMNVDDMDVINMTMTIYHGIVGCFAEVFGVFRFVARFLFCPKCRKKSDTQRGNFITRSSSFIQFRHV